MIMLCVQQAESTILELVSPWSQPEDTETLPLGTALGRVLAAPAIANLDFPHWDNSAMDGYAVKYSDVQECHANFPTVLKVVEEIPAGYQPQCSLKPGQAARIFTGGMLPQGADTVVIQENTEPEGEHVKILAAPAPQEFVRHRGSFYQAGSPLLPRGTMLSAPEIAILAAAQNTEITVYRRPRVAILSTGNELVSPDSFLQPGQIVDSNQYALAAFVTSNGGVPIQLGIVPDCPDAIKAAIAQAVAVADFVLSTGGVSVGEYDYVDKILTQLGAKIHVSSVAVKPGKPLTVAAFDECVYFGLPGNPVSALVSCWRFVQPALRKLSGQSRWLPTFVKARSRQELRSGGKRETYLWGQLHLVEGAYEFELSGGSHSSGNLINLARTNGLAVMPVGQSSLAAGERVEVMQIVAAPYL